MGTRPCEPSEGRAACWGRSLQLWDGRQLEGDVLCCFQEKLPSPLSLPVAWAVPPAKPLWCLPSLSSRALQGCIEPGREQVRKVCYLPGVPGVFCRTFQLQVGHLRAEEISLKGEGSFPRIYLDLPRNIKGEHCLSASRAGPLVFPTCEIPPGQLPATSSKAGGFRAVRATLNRLVAS